jgi:hypothetical protein
MAFMGLSSAMVVAVLPFGVELSYPISEAFSTGMLFTFALAWSVVEGMICIYVNEINPDISVGIFIVTSAVASVLSFFIKNDLRRSKEAEKRST